jgi:hypothetical protein
MTRIPLVALAALLCSCAAGTVPRLSSAPSPAPAWSFFAKAPADVWSGKIEDWQRRQRSDRPALAEREPKASLFPAEHDLLLAKSDAFRQRERRALATRITAFSQAEARRHYRWDPETDLASDPWPTSLELYQRDGDDCDGLDLIAYDLLLQFGFPPEELYRAVLRRERDGAHHMATLWFERPDDPWLIDATGAISRRMARLSNVRGWTPLRVFDERAQWAVEPLAPAAPAPAAPTRARRGVVYVPRHARCLPPPKRTRSRVPCKVTAGGRPLRPPAKRRSCDASPSRPSPTT